jgi:hypothetical protein
MKRYGKGQISSVELEKGVGGRPFLPLGNRDFVEFTIEVQGMVEALPGSALEDALQLDVTGPVAVAKGLQAVFGILDASFVQVGTKLCAICIRAK